jgi:hypothetical protein
MSQPGYTQYDAGVLDENDALTLAAQESFIARVEELLERGGPPIPAFPCFGQMKPYGAINLRDKDKYPDFWNNSLPNYNEIAKSLDVKGQRMLMPFFIFDPLSFCVDFNLNAPNIPDIPSLLAIIPRIQLELPNWGALPDLVAKIPTLPIPQIPSLKLPPIPNLNPNLYLDLILFKSWYLKLPKLFADLMLKFATPSLVLDLPTLKLTPICKAIKEAELFGPVPPGSAVKIATTQALAEKTGESLLFTIEGCILGSSSGGAVGLSAKELGYTPPGSKSAKKITGKTLIRVPGIENTSATFKQKLIEIGERLNINPDYIATVISIETAKTFSPSIRPKYYDEKGRLQKTGGAVGLIQFLPFAAKELGTTTEQLANMTAEQQLDYVEKFYARVTHNGQIKIDSAGKLHMATFLPAYIGASDNTVLATKPSAEYVQNSRLDTDKSSTITAGEMRSIANGVYYVNKGNRISADT